MNEESQHENAGGLDGRSQEANESHAMNGDHFRYSKNEAREDGAAQSLTREKSDVPAGRSTNEVQQWTIQYRPVARDGRKYREMKTWIDMKHY